MCNGVGHIYPRQKCPLSWEGLERNGERVKSAGESVESRENDGVTDVKKRANIELAQCTANVHV